MYHAIGYIEKGTDKQFQRQLFEKISDSKKMNDVELNGSLYDKLELEKEIQQKITSKVDLLASNWKSVDFNDKTTIW